MPSELLLYIALGVSSIALVGVIYISVKINKFFRNGEKDIESLLTNILERTDHLNKENKEIEIAIKELFKKNSGSIRGVQSMRYNPFKDQGGNQSFSVALVDEGGNGVIFSSLYSRERNSFFLKPVAKGITEHELTGEEKTVLKKAIEKTK
jgi:hypothetical protein